MRTTPHPIATIVRMYIRFGLAAILSCAGTLPFIVERSAVAQEVQTQAPDEQGVMEQWKEVYDKIVESIRVTAGPPDAELKLDRSKVLAINNPDHDTRHGSVYLYTSHGKPLVLCSIMSKTASDNAEQRTVSYEFHSLCEDSIVAQKGSRRIWRCSEPGISWSAEADSENPSMSPARRLTQMRSIASQYSVKLIDANQPEDCRLLPQPIYRYPVETPNVEDGAIFAYVTSNNPKVYLLIKAQEGKWHVAFARSGRWKVEISRMDKLVHEFKEGTFQKSGPYYLLYVAERRLAKEPNQVIRLSFPD